MRAIWPSAVLLIALIGVSAGPARAADQFGSATPIKIGQGRVSDTGVDVSAYTSADLSGYGTETNEGLTHTPWCEQLNGTSIHGTFSTDWTEVVGNGRQLRATVSAAWDNIMALYPTTISAWAQCNTRLNGATNYLEWDSGSGTEYRIQVGGCYQPVSGPYPCDLTPGAYSMTVTSAPPLNDARANATPFGTAESPRNFDNHGATVDGEGAPACTIGTETLQFRSTVWFKYAPDRFGTATFTATGIQADPIDTVMAIYRESDASYFSCNDDPGSSDGAAHLTVPVKKGETYYVQVGSYGSGGSLARQGTFKYTVDFVTDNDDGDPEKNDTDCADDDPGRFHGNTDVFNNGIDEDCDGKDDRDFDNDGYDFAPVGRDCDDQNPAINPGAKEIRGNRVDENCDGARPPGRLSPAPNVQLFSTLFPGRGRIFGDARIAPVARGYRIVLKCKGQGCGNRKRKVIVVKRGKSVRTKWTTGAVLAPGARFEISVTLPRANRIGVYQRNGVGRGNKAQTRNCDLEPETVDGLAFRRVRCGKA